MNSLLVRQTDALAFVQKSDSKNVRNRLQRFLNWSTAQGQDWRAAPKLTDYRDYLAGKGLSPASVNTHLSTIRGRYDVILQTSAYRDYLYAVFAHNAPDGTLADSKAYVDETIGRVYAALNPKQTRLKVITRQDIAESEQGIRLTTDQASALLNLPNLTTRQGFRDLALIAFALCTGLRESELSALDVEDLRQRLNDELAVRVREGKGSKQRLVPYGQLSWCLAIVDAWIARAGITSGAVFRSFRKGDKVSDRRLSVRAVEAIVGKYEVCIAGDCLTLAPHDLRRTYARLCYDAGMGILEIQRNLGHSDHKTTERYIGAGSAANRAPQSIYKFDLNKLRR